MHPNQGLNLQPFWCMLQPTEPPNQGWRTCVLVESQRRKLKPKPGRSLISNRKLKKTRGKGRTHTHPASEKY